MSLCVSCKKDSDQHSKTLWDLHQSKETCRFCNKSAGEHSEKLWNMHKMTVQKGQYCFEHHKVEKLYPIRLGFARESIGRVHELLPDGARICECRDLHTNELRVHELLPNGPAEKITSAEPFYSLEIVPIYMHCTQCKLAMGDIETDNADVLDGLCLECFRETTEQTDSWYDIPSYRSYEYCQKIRKRMEEKK